jgi:hypothetical protein
MAAIIVLNALIGEGKMSELSNRLRHWGVPVRANHVTELPKESDAVSE